MRLTARILALGAVAAAASVGTALSAGTGVVNGNLNLCVHQNGGAVTTAGSNGCNGNDSAVSVVTPSGTVQNALTLNGLPADSFLRALGGGTFQSGFLRMACAGEFPASTHDIPVQGFGMIEFKCGLLPNIGSDMHVSMLASSGFIFGTIEDPTLHQSRSSSFDFPGSVVIDVCCASEVSAQARNTNAGPTVSLRASIIPELGEIDEASQYWDVLYEVTES